MSDILDHMLDDCDRAIAALPEDKTVVVDGREYTALSGSEKCGVMRLRGKRGGDYTLVRNIRHGYWVLISGGARPKEKHVRSVEVSDASPANGEACDSSCSIRKSRGGECAHGLRACHGERATAK